MKPVRTFIQQHSIKALLAAEKPIYDLSGGKLARNRFLSSVPVKPVGSTVRILRESETAVDIAKYRPDGSFDTESDFVVLHATDLHLDEDAALNDKTLKMLCRHIAEVKPDLVVFTGDVVLSKYQQIDAIQFAMLMEELGVYWAYVFGNHEAREEKEYFKYLLLKSMSMFPHCLSRFGKKELYGYGNFLINIFDGEQSLRETLVFFDSGRNITEPHRTRDGIPADLQGYDYIKPSQIAWYTQELARLKARYGSARNMLYLHIPIPEYAAAFTEQPDGSYVPSGKAEILYGHMYESVGCSPYNSGLFDKMKQNGAVAIFAGHDHVNDFAARLDGILLVYNQPGCYNGYGFWGYHGLVRPEQDWPQGVTVARIHKNGDVTPCQRFNARYLPESKEEHA